MKTKTPPEQLAIRILRQTVETIAGEDPGPDRQAQRLIGTARAALKRIRELHGVRS